MKHLHWFFVAFEGISEDKHTYYFPTEVEVSDFLTEEAALKEVKRIVKRPNYNLKKVWECQKCLLDDEYLKLNTKHIKDHD